MKNNTLLYALSVLDVQLSHCKGDPNQYAFYCGMRDMLNIIVTDGYTNQTRGVEQGYPGHKIRRGNGAIIQSNGATEKAIRYYG